MKPGYRILEHPADLGIEARGKSLAEAFEQAAEALVAILLDPSEILPRQELTIRLSASDGDHLLVRWLSEILYQVDARGFVPKTFAVRIVGSRRLVATLRGEGLDLDRHATRTDVKAVTYHQLSVRKTPGGAVLRVFLDI